MSRPAQPILRRGFWIPERDELLRHFYPLVPMEEIADALQIGRHQVHSRVKILRLRKTAEHRSWLPVELQLLREIYPDVPGRDVAALLDRCVSSVHRKAFKLGLAKSEYFKAADYSGRVQRGHQDPRMVGARFQKGLVPWNKGTHFTAGGRSAETRFKKGRAAHEARNYKPIGSLRIDPKDGYLQRKVTDDPSIVPAQRWVSVHRLVWQAAHGTIPEKHVVSFRPGQFTNKLEEITEDRLQLLSMAENAARNHWRNNPTLKALVPLKTHITRQANRISREAKERSAS